MAVANDNKNTRIARWERKQKQNVQEKRIRAVLKDRKQRRKSGRGVDQILRHAPTKRTGRKFTLAVEQLWEAARRMKLAKSEHLTRPGYIGRDNAYLYALAQMADRFDSWLRDPCDFRPRSHNTERQFTELARHLFTRFAPPPCFEQAWFERDPRKARRHQHWYIQLGQGESARRLAGLPIVMTRRTAHLLADAPATLTIEQGLRWTQLRAIGAGPALTEALLASPVGTDFARDAFWMTVVRFMIDQPMLDPNQVGPIVDYIHYQRHEPQYGLGGDAVPAQPNFSMKGRSIRTLLGQVRQWHGRLATRKTGRAYLRWDASRIPGMQWVEGQNDSRKHLVIRELLDSATLDHEGARMNHCVGSYAQSCKSGRAAIFTLTCASKSQVKTLLTVEVKPLARTIVQARGKCNRSATQDERRMLRAWAQQADLQMSDWV